MERLTIGVSRHAAERRLGRIEDAIFHTLDELRIVIFDNTDLFIEG